MASKGSFGGGLSPFGSGGSAGFQGYSIGSQLAQLDAYKASVGWQNGTVSDDAYIASLEKVLAATTPETTAQISAQNTLDNAKYGIGRQAAQDKGLDDLIAFDQKALAGMRTDNQHADDVKNALGSELAQRRSKDYSDLVSKVNKGDASTQSLLDWVVATIKTLPSDAPDKDNWVKARDSVAASVQTENDSKAYQDYSAQRISGASFLAYVTARRDQYGTDSPNYAEWGRKLEDATKNVTDTAQSAKDTAFFDQYNEGHASDADYLTYIKTRLDTMAPSDPQYETWHHRYETTAYSLAEDQLRFAVSQGTRPVSSLVSFYQSYASTLNQGSAEWRTTQSKIDSLKGSGGSGGGSGSGGGNNSSAITGPKIVDGSASLTTMLHDMALPVNATSADEAMFTANYNSLSDAHQHGDKVWVFIDPKNPGGVVAGQNPDGSPMLDAKGKAVLVRGATYFPVTDEALGNLNTLDATHHADLAATAKDLKTFYSETNQSNVALRRNRDLSLQTYQKSGALEQKNALSVIEQQLATGDTVGAYNTTMAAFRDLAAATKDPMMDASTKASLQADMDKLAAQPFMPQYDDTTNKRTGGAVINELSTFDAQGNMTKAYMDPSYHFVLADGVSQKTNGWVQDAAFGSRAEVWGGEHMTVTAQYKGQKVTGEVEIHQALVAPKVYAYINGVFQTIDAPGNRVSESQYQDEYGRTVVMYSIDGKTWLSSNDYTAGLPQLLFQPELKRDDYGKLTDAKTGATVGQQDLVTGNYKFDSSASFDWAGLGDPSNPYTVYSSDGHTLDVRTFDEKYDPWSPASGTPRPLDAPTGREAADAWLVAAPARQAADAPTGREAADAWLADAAAKQAAAAAAAPTGQDAARAWQAANPPPLPPPLNTPTSSAPPLPPAQFYTPPAPISRPEIPVVPVAPAPKKAPAREAPVKITTGRYTGKALG